MDELMMNLMTPASQVALIIGIAEIVKKAGLEAKYIPLVDLALGLLSGILLFGIALGYGIANGIVTGIALGLSACGLFSGVKNLTEKEEKGND